MVAVGNPTPPNFKALSVNKHFPHWVLFEAHLKVWDKLLKHGTHGGSGKSYTTNLSVECEQTFSSVGFV